MKNFDSKITKQEPVKWRELKWLQSSKLKEPGSKGLDKLKNSLKENGFVQPFNVWQDAKGVVWILDGHHREKALKQLEAEGYEIPEMLPANFIDCADRKAAAKMVLVYSSIYAKITNDGLGEFLDDFELDLGDLANEIDLPNVDLGLSLDESLISDSFELPDGDKPPFQGMSFTLADDQATLIKNALDRVKKTDEFKYMETYGNENSNGNALALVVEQWEKQKI